MTAFNVRADDEVTVTDMFCGAGGSSLGAALAGAVPRYGLNHWDRAVETHHTNFPNAEHDCADISATEPRRYRRTRILLASPECTNHSVAKGARRVIEDLNLLDEAPLSDAAQERSRATMYDVLRFTAVHDYDAVVVENVVDAYHWGNKTPRKKMGDGVLFQHWVQGMRVMGYEHEIVWMNSMFAPPTPQSRDRMYVVFWKKTMRRPNLRFDVPSWCPKCERAVDGVQTWKRPGPAVWGRYAEQYVYACPNEGCRATVIPGAMPAAAAIDWTLLGDLIGDRTDPLAKNTRDRIRRGMERVSAEPFSARLEVQRGRPRTLPLMPVATGAVQLPVAGNLYETTPGNRASLVDHQPVPVVHTSEAMGLVVPPGSNGVAFDATGDALGVQTTTTRPALVTALRNNATSGLAGSDPIRTVAASGEHHALVQPIGSSFGANQGHSEMHPMRTLTTADNLAVVMANYSPGWARDAHLDQFGSVTTKDGHALLMPYYSNGEAKGACEPVGALTTKDRYALVVPTLDVPSPTPVTWSDEMIDACRFRMFQPHEIAAAMQMRHHVDGSDYVVLGTRTERMKQYGNAVTPPVMAMIVSRLMEVL